MQCLGVKTSEELRFPFADGVHYFFGPQRCRNSARNSNLCRSCNMRTRDCNQSNSMFDHGQCDRGVPPWSRLYGGMLYRLESKKYGEPSIEIVNKVKAMHDRVRSLETSADYGSWKLRVENSEEQKYPMPNGRGRAREHTKKMDKGIIDGDKSNVQPYAQKEAKFVETAVDIEKKIVDEIEEIRVKKVVIDGKEMYMDMTKNNLYDHQFRYIGRWNNVDTCNLSKLPDA